MRERDEERARQSADAARLLDSYEADRRRLVEALQAEKREREADRQRLQEARGKGHSLSLRCTCARATRSLHGPLARGPLGSSPRRPYPHGHPHPLAPAPAPNPPPPSFFLSLLTRFPPSLFPLHTSHFTLPYQEAEAQRAAAAESLAEARAETARIASEV